MKISLRILLLLLCAVFSLQKIHSQNEGSTSYGHFCYGTYDLSKSFVDVNNNMNFCWLQPDGTVFIDWVGNVNDSVKSFVNPTKTYTAPETVKDKFGNVYTVSGVAANGIHITDGSGRSRNTEGFIAFFNSIYSSSENSDTVRYIILPECYKYIDTQINTYNVLYGIDAPGVTRLGDNVFDNCTRLRTVNIPKLKIIGQRCFAFCNRLRAVNFPDLEAYSSNGYACFESCDSIKEVHFPKLKLLGDRFFMSCESLKILDLPSVTDLDSTVYSGVYSGGSQILDGASGLEYVNLKNLKHLGELFVAGYFTKLTKVNLESIVDAHDVGFMRLTAVDSLYLPNFETFISSDNKEHALNYQFLTTPNKLKYLYIPKYRQAINEPLLGFINDGSSSMSYGKCNLKYLNAASSPSFICRFPADDLDTLIISSATSIDLNASSLVSMKNLKYLDISSLKSFTPWGSSHAPQLMTSDSIHHIICYDADVLRQFNALHDPKYSGTLSLDTYNSTASNYPSFETVELVNQTTDMPDDVFNKLPNIKHLILRDGSTSYSGRALSRLEKLEDITVSDGRSDYSTRNGVLYDAAGKKLLYYPQANEGSKDAHGNERMWTLDKEGEAKPEAIGPAAFYHFKNVRQIAFDQNINEIDDNAFDGSHINRITFNLNAPLASVGNYAFANMTEPYFRYLKMPKHLETIGEGAFSGDTQLQALEVYNTALTTVGDNAFAGQTAITSIALPNSVTTIGKEAFKGNTAMTYFTMPKHCTSLGENAFSGCSADLIIKIPETQLTSDNLSAAFASTDTKAKLLVPSEKQGDFVGWSFDAATKTVNIPANRYVSFTRSYPIAITDTTGVKWTRFYRAVGIEDEKNDKGQYVIKLKRLYAKDLKLIPANSPILMYFEHIDKEGNKLPDSSTATESFSYSICANTNDFAYSEDSPVKAAPGAIRMDRQETDYDGNDYTNFILSSSDSNTGTYNLVADNPWYDVATRTGEKSYLHFLGDGTDTKAKGFVFSIDNSYDDPFATGIKDITDIKGNTSKVNDGAWYTLSGSRTSKPQHGIYIHNGKKVVVK